MNYEKNYIKLNLIIILNYKMKQTAVIALIGTTNAFGAMDNQWKLWDKFNQVSGTDELI